MLNRCPVCLPGTQMITVASLWFTMWSSFVSVCQQIRGLCIAHQKEHILAEELRDVSMKILRATDDAVRSYTELRNKFHLPSSIRASSVHTSTQMAGLAGIYSAADQPSMPFPAASGFPFMIARPSSFMLKTLARFDQYLTKISQQIVELEQLVQPTSEFSSSSVSSLQSIPRIMSNVHDFFIHVAAKVIYTTTHKLQISPLY